MGKEFIEYKSDNGRVPYSGSTICCCLTQYAKDYIKEEHPLTKDIDSKVRDAVLVDAINCIGAKGFLDFALYTKDLYNDRKHEEKVESSALLTIMANYCANYLFNNNLVESVLRNKHMNECNEEFDINDGALVVIDFINYVSKRNGYDKVFTLKELYDKYQKWQYAVDMETLKSFLESTNEFNERLLNGEKIADIYNDIARKHDLKFVDTNGQYYYTDRVAKSIGVSKMTYWDTIKLDIDLNLLAYSYAKLNNGQKAKIKIIDKKINEMKKR